MLTKAISRVIPIERHEWKKFLPTALMMLFVLFNYTVLRSLKDALIVSGIGAEAISFAKLYAVLPSAILFMLVYSKMTAALKTQTIFYTMATFFLVYFIAFVYLIYPNTDVLHPDPASLARLSASEVDLGFFTLHMSHFQWFIKLYGSWTSVMFYVMAELWGSIMLSLLFWQFANSITPTSEAKRFYPMFGLVGNIGLLGCSYAIEALKDRPDIMVTGLVLLLALGAVLIIALYYYMNSSVLKDPRYMPAKTVSSVKKEKVSLSFKDGIKVILSSKYIGLIALLMFSYGASINLVEGPWKSKIKELYPLKEDYLLFMSKLQRYTAVCTMSIMFVGAHILKRISWKTGAMLTPIVILVTGLGFFLFVVFQDQLSPMFSGMLATAGPLYLAVQMGLWQNATAKGTKYAFFDATKEMAYIPADKELQTKGKAAADIVAARFAKSFGSIVQSTLLLIFPAATLQTFTPYFMAIFLVIVIGWIYAVNALSKEYEHSLQNHKPAK